MPGARGSSIKLGAAHTAKYPSGQLFPNIGAKIWQLSVSSCCSCCLASPLLRRLSPSCGACCEEVGASVEEQKDPSSRRLILSFRQLLASGLATAACVVPTLLASEPVLDTSASPLVPMAIAGPPSPSRLATGAMRD